MLWETGRRTLDLSRKGVIMGIVNVTPDSFSDGGHYTDPIAAIAHGIQMADEGAEIIDIGGESTRPGAQPVSAEEELRRVIPVIRGLRKKTDILLSIDTYKAEIARAAIAEGADILNDVTALRGDPGMMQVAAECDAGVVLTHMQGTPQTMQDNPHYEDVVAEVGNFLRQQTAEAVASGIRLNRIIVDPGIGFGKTLAHNLRLLRSLDAFAERPVLVGLSRKSFLGKLVNSPDMEDRFWPGVALTAYCRGKGARIFRVHEARPHRDALQMTEALMEVPAA
ncbi:MAG: dihydropteroate synthase [Chthoniobacterales bacterium]